MIAELSLYNVAPLATLSYADVSTWASGTSYAPYNGTHQVGGYEVDSNQTLATANYDKTGVDAIQMQKNAGTVTFKNIVAKKVVVTFLSKYELAANSLPILTFGSNTFSVR